MRVEFSPDVLKFFKRTKIKNKGLASKIEEKLAIFVQNQNHPSLRLHKLSGSYNDRWSISITDSVRMVFLRRLDNTIYFVAIGTHDQVYREN